jgi:hypothetical protein
VGPISDPAALSIVWQRKGVGAEERVQEPFSRGKESGAVLGTPLVIPYSQDMRRKGVGREWHEDSPKPV